MFIDLPIGKKSIIGSGCECGIVRGKGGGNVIHEFGVEVKENDKEWMRDGLLRGRGGDEMLRKDQASG